MTVDGSRNGATVGIAPTRSVPPSAESRTARSASFTAARMTLRVTEQFLTGVGEHDLPPESVEQPPVHPVILAFEPHDLFAERRLRHTLALRGAREAARFGHRDEIPELVKFHSRFR